MNAPTQPVQAADTQLSTDGLTANQRVSVLIVDRPEIDLAGLLREAIGITEPATVAAIADGSRPLRVAEAAFLADALGVSVTWLLTGVQPVASRVSYRICTDTGAQG